MAGRNEEANRMAIGLFEAMLGDFPPESRPALRSIGTDLSGTGWANQLQCPLEDRPNALITA